MVNFLWFDIIILYMKIFIGSDHAGFEMKRELISFLKDSGFDVYDLAASS